VNKTATRIPEALWLRFKLDPEAAVDADSWRLHKMGTEVDPQEVRGGGGEGGGAPPGEGSKRQQQQQGAFPGMLCGTRDRGVCKGGWEAVMTVVQKALHKMGL